LKPSRQGHFNKGNLFRNDSKVVLISAWTKAIQNNNLTSWNQKLSKALEAIRFVDIELTRKQQTKWRAEYNSQTQVLELAKLDLQRNWNDQAKRDTLNEAQARIQYVHQEKLEVKTHFSIAKWITLGDKCSKKFFNFFFHNGRPINEFSNQGQILIYHKRMLILAQSFF
jgi:hypothetical protein